jgi:hypothetical protein
MWDEVGVIDLHALLLGAAAGYVIVGLGCWVWVALRVVVC